MLIPFLIAERKKIICVYNICNCLKGEFCSSATTIMPLTLKAKSYLGYLTLTLPWNKKGWTKPKWRNIRGYSSNPRQIWNQSKEIMIKHIEKLNKRIHSIEIEAAESLTQQQHPWGRESLLLVCIHIITERPIENHPRGQRSFH